MCSFKKCYLKKWGKDLRSPKKTCRWLTNTWKDAQHHPLLEKCKSKLQYQLAPVRMAIKKSTNNKCSPCVQAETKQCSVRLPSTSQFKSWCHGVSESQLSLTLSNPMDCSLPGFSIHVEIPLKTGNRTAIQSSNPTPGHTHQENQNWKRHVYPNVHCSTVYNSQDMEAT